MMYSATFGANAEKISFGGAVNRLTPMGIS